MYFSPSELLIMVSFGAGFVLWGVVSLLLGDNSTATTVLLAGLMLLGIYIWYEDFQPSR